MNLFHFDGFNPEAAIAQKAERFHDWLIEATPDGTHISARLTWDGERYRCSVELGMPGGPVSVEVAHRIAAIALDKAELSLRRKLALPYAARVSPARAWKELTSA